MDTLGLILKAVVYEAEVQDRDGDMWLLLAIMGVFPRLVKIWAEGAYRGIFIDWAKAVLQLQVEIVERDPLCKAFRCSPVAGWSNAASPD